MIERLQKILAASGIASRRHAEALIADGHVTVNGKVARLGDRADPDSDAIAVYGMRVHRQTEHVYVALHKPVGYVTSLRSTHGERTVVNLLPPVPGIFPAGRLDKDTSGLLLATNDGAWGNIVSHPRYGVGKEYRAMLRGHPSQEALQRLRSGVRLADGQITAPAVVHLLSSHGPNVEVAITLIQGKKRQIRLMAQAVGHPVLELRRIRIGPIELGTLAVGKYRNIRPQDVESIRAYGRRESTQRGGTTRHANRH